MSPFFFLLAVYGLLYLRPLRTRWPGGPEPWHKAAGAMGLALLAAAFAHFVRPEMFLPMVPSFLPDPERIVFISGIAEGVVGLALLLPRTRRTAGWVAAALFVAIWPGSIHTAISGDYPPRLPTTPLYHWARVPFHALYVLWGAWIGMGRLPAILCPASARPVKTRPDSS